MLVLVTHPALYPTHTRVCQGRCSPPKQAIHTAHRSVACRKMVTEIPPMELEGFLDNLFPVEISFLPYKKGMWESNSIVTETLLEDIIWPRNTPDRGTWSWACNTIVPDNTKTYVQPAHWRSSHAQWWGSVIIGFNYLQFSGLGFLRLDTEKAVQIVSITKYRKALELIYRTLS